MYSHNGPGLLKPNQYFQEITWSHHPWKYWPSFINPSWKWRGFRHEQRHMNLPTSDLLNCHTASKWALIWSQTDKLIQLWKQGHAAPVPYLHMTEPNLCVFGNSWPIKSDAWRSSISICYMAERIQQNRPWLLIFTREIHHQFSSIKTFQVHPWRVSPFVNHDFDAELNCCSFAEEYIQRASWHKTSFSYERTMLSKCISDASTPLDERRHREKGWKRQIRLQGSEVNLGTIACSLRLLPREKTASVRAARGGASGQEGSTTQLVLPDAHTQGKQLSRPESTSEGKLDTLFSGQLTVGSTQPTRSSET